MEVISQTPGKVDFIHYFGRDLVKKKTSFHEVKELIKMAHLLKNKKVYFQGQSYEIKVPRIQDYINNHLYMERCEGENLEIMLRQGNNLSRFKSVEMTNELLRFFIGEGIFWRDFAPRNIMIDEKSKRISIFDMERGVDENVALHSYLENFVYEEYAAFLLPEERIFFPADFLGKITQAPDILFDDIKSKRIRTILTHLKMNTPQVKFSSCEQVLLMILNAEEPYIEKGKYVFPIVELEELKDKSYGAYAKKIIEINKKNITNFTSYSRGRNER